MSEDSGAGSVIKEASKELGIEQDPDFFGPIDKTGVERSMDSLAEGAKNLDSYAKEASNGISVRDALSAGGSWGGSQSAAFEKGR